MTDQSRQSKQRVWHENQLSMLEKLKGHCGRNILGRGTALYNELREACKGRVMEGLAELGSVFQYDQKPVQDSQQRTEKRMILEVGSTIFISELDMEGEEKREIKSRWFMQFWF